MNDIMSEYFTLNSSKSVDKGNGVAMFCAIVSIFACSYSLNLKSKNNQVTQTPPVISEAEETESKNINAAQPASHQR